MRANRKYKSYLFDFAAAFYQLSNKSKPVFGKYCVLLASTLSTTGSSSCNSKIFVVSVFYKNNYKKTLIIYI